MVRHLLIFGILIHISLSASIGQEVVQLPFESVEISKPWPDAERSFHSAIWDNPVVTNVSKPSLTVFRPKEPNGTAVVVCPGGGLYALSIDSEGNDVAKWLAAKGITAFVLKYRLVPTGEDGTADIAADSGPTVLKRAGEVLPLAVKDALQAIRHVRENATTYRVAEDRIGLIGFSAGGAVTMGATYAYDEASRPNFIGPIYAWMNVVPKHDVPEDAPIMFALCASDDPLILAPASVKLYTDWLKAGKSAELHMYSQGGHGFGMKAQHLPTDRWIERFYDWLVAHGYH